MSESVVLALSNKHVVAPLFRPYPDVSLFVGVLLFICCSCRQPERGLPIHCAAVKREFKFQSVGGPIRKHNDVIH